MSRFYGSLCINETITSKFINFKLGKNISSHYHGRPIFFPGVGKLGVWGRKSSSAVYRDEALVGVWGKAPRSRR